MTKDISFFSYDNATGETKEIDINELWQPHKPKTKDIPHTWTFTKVYDDKNIWVMALTSSLIKPRDLWVLTLLSYYMDYSNNCKMNINQLPWYTRAYHRSLTRLKQAWLILRAKHIDTWIFIHPLFSSKWRTTPKPIVELFKQFTKDIYSINIYKHMISKK